MIVNRQTHFSLEARKKVAAFPWDLLALCLACLLNVLEWLHVSLLKDNVLMSKNGLSVEDISHT